MHSRSDSIASPVNGSAAAPAPVHAAPQPATPHQPVVARHRAPTAAEVFEPATQIVSNRADYLGEGQNDIGQRIAPDRLEMFVGTDPAQALLQTLAQCKPDYIALHDLSASAGLRLVHAIAGALGAPLQQLAIRRQGHGVPLATLRFVEIPGRGKSGLRVYSTDVDADSQSRRQLAQVLLAHARLGVLLVGSLPSHALATALQPLGEAMRQGFWPGRDLLMVPLSPTVSLAGPANTLAGDTRVRVQVAEPAARPNEVWTRITSTWNQLRDDRGGQASASASAPASGTAPASTLAPGPMPAAATAADPRRSSAAGNPLWPRYLQACNDIKGLVSACLFDFRSVQLLGHTGARPDPDRLVSQGVALFNAMAESGRALGLGASQPDATISLTGHHLLLHPLPGHPGILLHAVLDGSIANLTLARMQLQRVDVSVLGARSTA